MKYKNWLIIFIISIFTIALALVPLWYAYSQIPEGHQMAGIGRDDEYGLFAWAKQAQQGHWLFLNPYSLESVKRQLFNPLFLILGKLSLVLNNDLVLTFNLARVGLGLVFLLTSYWFFGNFFRKKRARLAAFLILCFSSGLGWWLFFVPSAKAPFLFSAVSSTEALSFPSLLFYPHFTAALTMMMVCFVFYLRLVKSGKWSDWLVSCLAGSLLIATHPHESLALVLVPVVYLFLSQGASLKQWLRTFFYWVGLGPMVAYFGLLSQLDPVYKQFTQTPLAPLSWLDFIGAYGLLLPLAGWGAFKALTTKKSLKSRTDNYFALAWVVTVMLLLLVPFGFQRKMVMGFHLPLVILVVLGIKVWWMKIKSKFVAWSILIGLVLVLAPQNLYFVKSRVAEISAEKEVYQLSDSFLKAQQWLEDNVEPESVILANPAIGLVTPAMAGRKVFLGHWGNTNFSEEKAEKLFTFLSSETDEVGRLNFFKEYSLDYYWHDQEGVAYNRWVFNVERQKGIRIQELEKDFDPSQKDYLELVFENSAAKIYKVDFK
ncbi:hypothetical protein ACFL0Y_02785 [Patescibacteria group bacterium]